MESEIKRFDEKPFSYHLASRTDDLLAKLTPDKILDPFGIQKTIGMFISKNSQRAGDSGIGIYNNSIGIASEVEKISVSYDTYRGTTREASEMDMNKEFVSLDQYEN
jgi:hypothetical protein